MGFAAVPVCTHMCLRISFSNESWGNALLYTLCTLWWLQRVENEYTEGAGFGIVSTHIELEAGSQWCTKSTNFDKPIDWPSQTCSHILCMRHKHDCMAGPDGSAWWREAGRTTHTHTHRERESNSVVFSGRQYSTTPRRSKLLFIFSAFHLLFRVRDQYRLQPTSNNKNHQTKKRKGTENMKRIDTLSSTYQCNASTTHTSTW